MHIHGRIYRRKKSKKSEEESGWFRMSGHVHVSRCLYNQTRTILAYTQAERYMDTCIDM